MINLFQDIWNVITSFALVDYILYFSVVTLIVLIVSLIYVIKNEKSDETKEQFDQKDINMKEIEKNLFETEDIDLQNIVDTIDENPTPLIDMTAYESEQEQKAIISYDELIKMEMPKKIEITDEELVDDLIPVKKIQISPIKVPEKSEEFVSGLKLTQKEPKFEVETELTPKETKEVRLFSYEKEEAFLKALQQLNELLN